MPIISATAISPHFQQKKSFLSYWTQQYKARVEADGGSIVSLAGTQRDVAAVYNTGEFEALELGVSVNGGFKTETNNGYKGVAKWYDISAQNNDPAQSTPAYQPSFYGSFGFQKGNEVAFGWDEGLGVKRLTHDAILNGNFTAFYVFRQQTTAEDFLHSGSLNAAGSGIWLTINSYGVAPAIYKQSPSVITRGATPVEKKNVVMTFQPSHIRRNGTEVSYKSGYTTDVPGVNFTTIGARADNLGTGYSFLGEIAAIFVFNKIIDNDKIIAFENYLLAEYCNTDYSGVAKLSSYTQLTYQILSLNGDKILAIDKTASPFKLKYSADNGGTFTDYNLTAGVNCNVGHIFDSGRLFVVLSSGKAYKSDDNLATLDELPLYDENGDPVATIHSAAPLQQLTKGYYGTTDEVISWGSYGAAPNMILASKNGDAVNITHRVGPDETIKGDHYHWVVYSESQNKWYAHTGDGGPEHEINWLEGTFNNTTGEWSWSVLYEGLSTLGQLTTGAIDVGDYLYFVVDAPLNANNMGVWRVPYSGIGDSANFQRIYMLPYEFGFIIYDEDENRIIQTVYHPNSQWGYTRKWEIFTYDLTSGDINRYYYDGVTPAYPNEGSVTKYQIYLRKHGGYYYLDYSSSSTPTGRTLKFQF